MIPWQITGPAAKPLLLMMPHFVSGRPNALAVRGETVEIPQGARIVDTGAAPQTGRHQFTFVCRNRAELAFLEGFFDTQKGRQGAFWFPTWQWELDVIAFDNPNAGSYRLWVRRSGYVEDFFPRGAQFRQLVIWRGDSYHTFTITAAVASVAPGIDRLALSEGGGASAPDLPGLAFGTQTAPDDSYRPLWLRWGRFDQDDRTAETMNGEEGSASLELAMTELPAEVPL